MDDASKADLERALLQAVSAGGVDDTGAFAAARGLKENDEGVTGVVKSLVAADMVAADNIKHSRVVLTATGRDFAAAGSAEARAHAATAPDGTSTMDELRAALGADVAKLRHGPPTSRKSPS